MGVLQLKGGLMAANPKQELHDLVEQLTDEDAADALDYVRRLVGAPARERAEEHTAGRALTADDLYADILPDDETADMMIETIRQWRREGGYA
jgi:hypothetical protein